MITKALLSIAIDLAKLPLAILESITDRLAYGVRLLEQEKDKL